ncbi:HET-domain-containing protein [Acephala macrosclerotiorum]|nr:HET-domain-containing protein [Acephala macrosclerotiorum]
MPLRLTQLGRLQSYVNDLRIEGRDISTDVGSGQSLAWIHQCLEACNSGEEEHKICLNHANQRPRLPMRVLDMSRSNEEDGDVRLKINTTDLLHGRYAALSHRWGTGSKPIITTTESVDAHISRIPFYKLPASFQDAVRLCRRLSIPYLWIDTLCIMQDSIADWTNQSVRMAQIYANAYLTIAFSYAWNSQCPILTSRLPIQTLRLGGKYSHVHLRCTEDENLESFWQGSKRAWGYDRHFVSTAGESSPLGSRAWAYQERILSRRTLFFTPCHLAWQCRSTTLVESSTSPQNPWKGLKPVFDTYNSEDEVLVAWESVLGTYNSLQFTFTSDKLVAISGIAKRFEKSLQYNYVAGLWRGALPRLLPWSTTDILIDRPKQYRAPSWSWAALDGGIMTKGVGQYYVYLPHPRDVVLLDVYVENAGSDEFGPVKDAWMSVRGFCFRIIHRIDTAMEWIMFDLTDWNEDGQFRGRMDVRGEFEEGGLYDHPDGVEFTLLQISRWRFCKGGHKEHDTHPILCLMLKEVEGRNGVYKRVGMVEVTERIDSMEVWEEKELVLI